MRVYLWILFFFFLANQALAQEPQVRKQSFEFEYQQLKVSKIHSDQSGFIWLGTQIGLFRHDGMNVDYFPFADSAQIDQISVLISNKNKDVFIGTKKGKLFKTQNGKLQLVSGFHNPHSYPIQSLAIDTNQAIWIGTGGAGVFILSESKQIQFTQDNGLPDNNVNALLADDNGQVWIGTDAGIRIARFYMGKGKFNLAQSKIKLADPFVTILKKGLHGSILIGTQSGIIYECPKNYQCTSLVPDERETNFGSVFDFEMKNGRLWIATETKGLVCLDDGVLDEGLNQSNSILPDKIVQITTDREGDIWVVNKTENVFTVNDLFSFLPATNTKSPIQAIACDLIGGVWYSNNQGTYMVKRGKHHSIPKEVSQTRAICIYPDSSGNIWLGTFGNGVLCYNPHKKSIKKYNEKNGLANNNVISISGNSTQIWLATFAGISIGDLSNIDNKQFRFGSAFLKYGLPKSYYYQVYFDSKGNIWLASDGQGLSVIKEGRLSFFSKSNGVEARIINSICEDSKGDIWFNSPEDGLFRFKDGRFSKFGTRDGIREIGYNSVCADKHNNLLIVNSRGIDMFNTQNQNILYHDKEIGFIAKAKEPRVSAMDVFGRIWVGAGSQLIVYNPPSNLLWQGPEPNIKRASVFLSPFEMETGKVFSSEENHITFDYVGIWYHLPEEVNYSIKLEGYDRDWVKSRNMQVTYPQLPPGDYVFRIKALPSNNFKSEKELTYSFTIKSPYYKTWWFILCTSILISLTIYLGFIWRVKQLREKEKMNSDRIQFQFETLRSQVNPHFLFNSFNTLAGLIEKNSADAVQYVDNLSDFFRSILQYKDKNLILLSDELAILNDYIFIQKKRFGAGFEVIIDPSLKMVNAYIAPMTLQILLENAIKHNVVSKNTPLIVRICSLENNFISISNPIQPKNTIEKSTQIGLSNIISRYSILQSRRVMVDKTNNLFEVKIPLIENDKYTDS